jgi:hypothetical protein
MLEDALSDDRRASVLERDAMLLSLVVGAIPGEVRAMQRRLDECEASVGEWRERIGQLCNDSGVSDTLAAYYQLNKKSRQCAALLASLSADIGQKLDNEVQVIEETKEETVVEEVPVGGRAGGRAGMRAPRRVVTKTTTTTRTLRD